MSIRSKIRSRINEEIDTRSQQALDTSVNYIISGASYVGGAARYRSGTKLISSGKSLIKSGMPRKKIFGIKTPKFNTPKFDSAKITSGAMAINKGLARKTQGKIIVGFGYVWNKLHN